MTQLIIFPIPIKIILLIVTIFIFISAESVTALKDHIQRDWLLNFNSDAQENKKTLALYNKLDKMASVLYIIFLFLFVITIIYFIKN